MISKVQLILPMLPLEKLLYLQYHREIKSVVLLYQRTGQQLPYNLVVEVGNDNCNKTAGLNPRRFMGTIRRFFRRQCNNFTLLQSEFNQFVNQSDRIKVKFKVRVWISFCFFPSSMLASFTRALILMYLSIALQLLSHVRLVLCILSKNLQPSKAILP